MNPGDVSSSFSPHTFPNVELLLPKVRGEILFSLEHELLDKVSSFSVTKTKKGFYFLIFKVIK